MKVGIVEVVNGVRQRVSDEMDYAEAKVMHAYPHRPWYIYEWWMCKDYPLAPDDEV